MCGLRHKRRVHQHQVGAFGQSLAAGCDGVLRAGSHGIPWGPAVQACSRAARTCARHSGATGERIDARSLQEVGARELPSKQVGELLSISLFCLLRSRNICDDSTQSGDTDRAQYKTVPRTANGNAVKQIRAVAKAYEALADAFSQLNNLPKLKAQVAAGTEIWTEVSHYLGVDCGHLARLFRVRQADHTGISQLALLYWQRVGLG